MREAQLSGPLYNLEVEGNHNYVANGILTHNCDHLEAVTRGKITRLLINVPPGSSKSMIVSVLWPAWEWAIGLGSMRYLATAFNDVPVKRDSRKMRELVRSEWYQTMFPHIKLVRAGEMSFANSLTGAREGSPFGSLTSLRADRLIIDDPHSVKLAESELERKSTTRLFEEGAMNRLNDQTRSAIVVIMQRLHESDMSGVILASDLGFVHLCIPMEFDAENRCVTPFWRDPREKDGDLMDPVRFPQSTLDRDFKRNAYLWAGQYQQRPGPRGGGLFKTDWWRYYNPSALPAVKRVIQSWDTAFKVKQDNDPSSCTIWAECENGYYLLHRHNAKMEYPLLKQFVISFGNKFWEGHKASAILVEDKASGQSLIQDLRQTSLPIVPVKVDTDKVTRANAVLPIIESGRVFLPEGADWLSDYVHELASFPTGKHDDDVDSTTQALRYMHLGNQDGLGFLDFYKSEIAKRGG